MGAVRLRDGRIVVANSGAHQLRIYDANGEHVVSSGGAGSGPAEFQFLSWIGATADSLFTWDSALQRLSVWDQSGRFVRSATLDDELGLFRNVVGRTSDGTRIVAAGVDSDAAGAQLGGSWRDSTAYLRVDPAGGVLDTLGRFPSTERYSSTMGSGQGLQIERNWILASALDGDQVQHVRVYGLNRS